MPVTDFPGDKYLNQYVRKKVCAAGFTTLRDLGIALMGQDAAVDLDVIRVDYPTNVEECCSRMFNKWRQTTPTGSWGKLLQALKEVKLIELVSELEELLSIEQGSKILQQQRFRLQELEGMIQQLNTVMALFSRDDIFTNFTKSSIS